MLDLSFIFSRLKNKKSLNRFPNTGIWNRNKGLNLLWNNLSGMWYWFSMLAIAVGLEETQAIKTKVINTGML